MSPSYELVSGGYCFSKRFTVAPQQGVSISCREDVLEVTWTDITLIFDRHESHHESNGNDYGTRYWYGLRLESPLPIERYTMTEFRLYVKDGTTLLLAAREVNRAHILGSGSRTVLQRLTIERSGMVSAWKGMCECKAQWLASHGCGQCIGPAYVPVPATAPA